jgi:hypothetical protein
VKPLSLVARGFQALCLTLIPQALAETFGQEPDDDLLRSDMLMGGSALIALAVLALFLWERLTAG